ncbi:hypothetical protein HELRODRAFT_105364 [Helobdella robusta]|uniref:Laminin IV type A domain-containing protein n=1 Tax=Helobdella robusta TaxID=6412 RepID=T1EDU0_HELRO|nr:hypothetical protein HELRODRAFT_105364 [Helobdella robusta]ESO12458.1 hypothetical protein HELRODRAFT_105364 [Helobdella robusta]
MIHINTPHREDAYWILPSKYYTYPLSLYKGALRYTASYYSSYPFHYGKPDVILRVEDTSQFLYYTYPDNTFPVDTPKEFVIPLYEAGWVDAQNNPVSRDTFMGVLKSLQSIWVRAKFSTGVDVEDRLSAVSVEYSVRDYEVELGQNGYPILEKCHCLPGYQGQWCEDCQPGYRKTVDDMHYVHCEQLDNIQCDPRTGHCQGCPHNTVGRNCECPHGFYMDRANNCEPCLCPVDASIDGREKVSCSLSSVGTLVCHNCPVGSTGSRCERCLFDYEGDPSIFGGRCVPTSDVPRPPVIETSDGDQKIDDKSFGDTM